VRERVMLEGEQFPPAGLQGADDWPQRGGDARRINGLVRLVRWDEAVWPLHPPTRLGATNAS